MRDYGKVSPQFWIGKTGKSLRGNPNAQIVALYLMTSPHSNMLGVYHLPRLYLAHETGLSPAAVESGLAACAEAGFCVYDDDTETVFVVEMAAHQVGETLKETDNRAKGIERQFRAITCRKIASAFFNRYGKAFNLESPFEAPSEGLEKGLFKPLTPAPVPSPPSVPVKGVRGKKGEVTLREWVAALDGGDAVPADDPLFAWAAKQGIPAEWIGLAWAAFEDRYADNGKRYAEWRAAFRDHVRRGWLDIWRVDQRNGGYVLTTVGEQWRREVTP